MLVRPDTILGWHRKRVAQKFDSSPQRKAPGRPTIDPELEALITCMARENRSWVYDRIVGALTNLGYTVSNQTVGNLLKRHGIVPAPKRNRPRRGRGLSGRIWTCWSPPTSSRPRSGRLEGW